MNKSEKAKIYYQKHRADIILIRICDCGGRYNKTSKARHMKCKKHLKFEILKLKNIEYTRIRNLKQVYNYL